MSEVLEKCVLKKRLFLYFSVVNSEKNHFVLTGCMCGYETFCIKFYSAFFVNVSKLR